MAYPTSRTLGDFLDEMVSKWPEQEFVVSKGRRYTYREMQEWTNQFARGLLALGLKKGDRVGSIVHNIPEFLVLLFAVAKCGGVFVPLSTFYRSKEIKYALRHCEIKILFSVGQLLNFNYFEMVKEILPELEQLDKSDLHFKDYPELKYVVSLAEQAKGAYSWEDVINLGVNVPDDRLQEAQGAVGAKDLAYILLTSGTTAHPKAVQMLHYGPIENTYHVGERQNMTPKDRMWVGIPVFYAMFNSNAMGAMMSHGGTLVLQEYFEPGEALRIIEEERCTVIYGFYNMIGTLLNHPDYTKRDLSSMRTGETIGSPEQIKVMAQLAPEICNVYGLTEVYGNSHLNNSNDPLEVRCRHAGQLLPGFQLKIIDPDTGEIVPRGQPGEACFKGFVTPGYYKDPENNRAAFDDDGWFHTGDIVKEDEEGNFYFITRMKEMLKTGGINVSPASVEDYLQTHPKIKEVYVIGYPDEKKGEAVMAVVEL
ncbi:MAG: AMP-binding protein, partial [Pseudomonadota bacterium]